MALKKTSVELLFDTIRMLLQKKELEDITVDEILEVSGVSRTTFYRHFEGKHDLAVQVFVKELSDPYFFDTGRNLYEREMDILNKIDQNRSFYRNAVKSEEFRRAWMEKDLVSVIEYLRTVYPRESISDDDLQVYALLIARTYFDVSMDWALHPPDCTAEEMSRILCVYCKQGIEGLRNSAPPSL